VNGKKGKILCLQFLRGGGGETAGIGREDIHAAWEEKGNRTESRQGRGLKKGREKEVRVDAGKS